MKEGKESKKVQERNRSKESEEGNTEERELGNDNNGWNRKGKEDRREAKGAKGM